MRSLLEPIGARRKHSVRKRRVALGGLFALACFAAFACSIPLDGGADERVGFDSPSENSPPTLGEADAGPGPEPGLCISLDCPSPYTTCSGVPGQCTVNLENDIAHCGACGNACAFDGGSGNASLYCIDGQCQVQCNSDYGDCNGQREDGCETNLQRDHANCGTCGNACQEGEVCWYGVCGCPPGFAQCGDQTCHRLAYDPQNCSECGNRCPFPDDAGPGAELWPCGVGVAPPNWGARCNNSKCDLGCDGQYADCNGELCTDGCETDITKDPNNCGACGKQCGPEQACVDGKCKCEGSSLAWCGAECVDTQTNAFHCGACGNACPGYRDSSATHLRGTPSCVLGRCSYYCGPGRANCDDDIDNGCEVDTMTDPMNCGGCGVQCDVDAGQPCAGGKCLTKPCDGADSGVVF